MTIDLEPVAVSYYGTLAGVQDLLKPTLTLSATSPVTSTDVTEELTALYIVLNTHLAGAGYTVPVTAASALEVLAWCTNRLVAADMLERLLVATTPTPYVVDTAQVWRKQANDFLDSVYAGDVALPDAERDTSSAASDTPSVSSTTSSFPPANTTALVDAYGGPFSGGPV